MKKFKVRWQLVMYDIIIYLISAFCLLFLYKGFVPLSWADIGIQCAISFVAIFLARFLGKIYNQVWRYGGMQCYLRFILADAVAFVVTAVVEHLLPITHVSFPRLLSVACLSLLGSITIRLAYRYAYKCANNKTPIGKSLNFLLHVFAGANVKKGIAESNKIKIAIVGAGRVGATLAEEIISNSKSEYNPRCFIDVRPDKVGRKINGLPVLKEDESVFEILKEYDVQEVVFAIPSLDEKQKKNLYEFYLKAGYKIKVYDYSFMQMSGKRYMREFDIEELLFRKPVQMNQERSATYYKDKVVLITGGGGSIGSELCRQLSKFEPRKLIILDIYENGAYDVQQELKIAYGNKLDVQVEIVSINNERGMDRVFSSHKPQIIINAAAHKHVPLMEKNCIEAVENNVFGTKVLVDLCEKYNAERFMMVSTDKAVNPTNVMGATKRMCEMIVQSASTYGKVKYSATRFGNVLGSAGSVIPLFKKQIANGGPITITDKRIIRYFMTIPEAAQLVLLSGAMANNGELFVLDMGQPIRIYDLAQNMVRLSGVNGIEIIETGLRPGEKLYEELLVKTEELDKTDNSLIFIEKDTPCEKSLIDAKLLALETACSTQDDGRVREALKQVVPTYKAPEEINKNAENSEEMKNQKEII